MVPTCRCIGQHAVTWLKELEDIAFSPFARRERKLHKTKATALSLLSPLTLPCLPLGWSGLIWELWLIGEQRSADEPGEWETSVSACISLKGNHADDDGACHKETKYAFYRKLGWVSFRREPWDTSCAQPRLLRSPEMLNEKMGIAERQPWLTREMEDWVSQHGCRPSEASVMFCALTVTSHPPSWGLTM